MAACPARGLGAFLDQFAFGLAAAWLTVRTGGLEAAIAMHAVGNVVGFTASAAYGELADYLAGPTPHIQAWEAAVDVALLGGLTYTIAAIARRRGIEARARVPGPPARYRPAPA